LLKLAFRLTEWSFSGTNKVSEMEEWDESGPEIVKRFMYVNRKAPYGTIYALECLEVVLITAAFEQFESLVFIDDGVFQLKKNQDTTGIGMKNFSKTYRALDDYDVERIYVEKESLEARGLTADDLVIPAEILTTDELREIMAQQDVVFSS
jgi:tRNA 2-thiouridine synthesizing protein C